MSKRLSIIIPTLNERDNISALVECLQRVMGTHTAYEILVVDSSQSTDDIRPLLSGENLTYQPSRHSSRALQMHQGAMSAQGKILFFVHADTRPPASFYESIMTAIDGGSLFGLFSYRFDSDSRLLAFNSTFTRRDGLFAGGGDQGFFITREAYMAYAGFDTSLPIMEDFEFYWRLKKLKVPFTIVPEDMLISARKYEKNTYIKVQLVNFITLLGFKWGWSPMKLKRFYTRHLR